MIMMTKANKKYEKQQEQYTQLYVAIEQNDQPEIDRLIQSGVDIDYQNNMGWSMLLNVIGQGRTEMARKLIELGADPLLEACHYGRLEIVKILLNAGANPAATLYQEEGEINALDIARKKGHEDIVDLLLSLGISS